MAMSAPDDSGFRPDYSLRNNYPLAVEGYGGRSVQHVAQRQSLADAAAERGIVRAREHPINRQPFRWNRGLFARHACTSANAARSSVGVPSARASMDLSMRLHSPESTLPGPHSKIFVAPFFTSDCTVSVHNTGMYNWRSSAARMNSMPACALASAFCSTGIAGT